MKACRPALNLQNPHKKAGSACNPRAGQEQAGKRWVLLAHQLHLLGEILAAERPGLKKQCAWHLRNNIKSWPLAWRPSFTNEHTHTHTSWSLSSAYCCRGKRILSSSLGYSVRFSLKIKQYSYKISKRKTQCFPRSSSAGEKSKEAFCLCTFMATHLSSSLHINNMATFSLLTFISPRQRWHRAHLLDCAVAHLTHTFFPSPYFFLSFILGIYSDSLMKGP